MAAPAIELKVATALRVVFRRVEEAAKRSGRRVEDVRVVAVGKTKPVTLISDLYDSGHRCFGENYVQELIQKAPQLPDDIKWHFIGHLQSNKVKPLLAAVPNLDMVESVDNEKIANLLDQIVTNLGRRPLRVLVQVNTSGEECEYFHGCYDLHDYLSVMECHIKQVEVRASFSRQSGETQSRVEWGGVERISFAINKDVDFDCFISFEHSSK